MTPKQQRLELFIDVFDMKNQKALALPTLTPPELVEAVLQEFRELEYLGDAPINYRLLKAADRAQLENDAPLSKQLANQEKLVLVENVLPLPKEAKRPTKRVYLRENPSGKVYKLHWVPAIIGRPDPAQANNDLVAIDLAAHSMGLRVSRRHAQISEDNGQFFIESMSQNPTTVRDAQGKKTTLGAKKHPLQPGDIISLDQSQITLKFIVK